MISASIVEQTINTILQFILNCLLNIEIMPVNSKVKSKKVMASCRSTLGRAFCVTGMQTSGSSTLLEGSNYESRKSADKSDSDSNTSGYLSSSSFESSGEEKRLVLNEQKVFNVWSKWSERVEIPKSSTPKQSADFVAYTKRANLCVDNSLLSIKKDLSKHTTSSENQELDSFWDIKTPKVHKSCSESDVRRFRDAPKHDAGSDLRKRHSSVQSQDWKRKPYLTMSDSQLDLRCTSRDSEKTRSYRVKVDADPVTNELAKQLGESCADFADTGVPVDESMSEFLSNVDTQNLVSFLNFYDRMTSGPAYEKARRNPKNYEASYF